MYALADSDKGAKLAVMARPDKAIANDDGNYSGRPIAVVTAVGL